MPSFPQLLRRARPYLTAGFNPNESDEPQQNNILSLLTRALQPQEAVQPQMLQRMPQMAAPVSSNPRSWDATDTGGRPFMPDSGPMLRAPEGVASRPRVVAPEQIKPAPLAPLTRQLPDDVTRAMPGPQVEAGQPQVLNRVTNDPSPLGTELASPRMVRPLPTNDVPDQPDRTLSVGEAETNYLNQLATRKPEDHNGRFRSALKAILPGLAAGGLGGGLGAFVSGLANPSWDEEREQQKEFGKHAGILARYNDQTDSELKRQLVTSQIGENAAQANALKNKPEADRQAREELERDNLRQIYQNLPEFDSQTNPEHKQIADRATQLGLTLPKKAKPVTQRNRQFVDLVQKDGSVRKMEVDETTGELVPAKIRGEGAAVSQPKPSGRGADGLTAYERLNLDLRRQGITYRKDKDQKQTQQSQQRYVDGTSKYYATRVAQAAAIAQKFDENRAKGLASEKKEDRDYWLAQAEGYRQQLAAFNDVYETGESKGTDGTMWGYAKPKVGKSVHAVMQGLKTNDPDEAVRYILDQGYVPVR